MRNKKRIAATFLIAAGTACAQDPAQQSSPSSFPDKISAQERAMNQSGTSTDGIAWLKLAILDQDAARYADAESAYRKAISLLKKKDRRDLATALDHMGTLYVEQGDFAKAEPMERKALEIREDEKDTEGIGISYAHLATLSFGQRDLAGAEADAEMAVSILVPDNPARLNEVRATPEEQMSALINLSLIRCEQGAPTGAVQDLQLALNLARAHYPANSVPVGFIDFLLGYVHWKSGDNDSAARLMLAGTTEMETQLGWGHPTYIAALRQYRTFLAQRGEAAEANQLGVRIASLEKSLDTQRGSSGMFAEFNSLR